MKPIIRYQSQLLFRKSYKPHRLNLIQRFRPGRKVIFSLRPVRLNAAETIVHA